MSPLYFSPFALVTSCFVLLNLSPSSSLGQALPIMRESDELNARQLRATAALATEIWAETGLRSEQIEYLKQLKYHIQPLPAGRLAALAGSEIKVAARPNGRAWRVVENLAEAVFERCASDSFDLLTVLLHEQGNALGLSDSTDAEDVMSAYTLPGQRRLPRKGQAERAVPGFVKASFNSSYHPLAIGPFSQDWSDITMITTNNDWSNVPSIIGFLGDYAALTPVNVDPRTLDTMDNSTISVVAQGNANSSPGAVYEIENGNPTIALHASGSADAPFLLLHLDSSQRRNVQVRYRLRELDADNAPNQVVLQFRTGVAGAWTNVADTYVQFSSSADEVYEIATTLPATADDRPVLQLRVITTNATGSDSMIGVDDILVTSESIYPELPFDQIALVGQQAPGLPAGVTFSFFGDLSLNSQGDCVIFARVRGPGVSAANDAGIWVQDASGLNLLLREGEATDVAGQTIAEPLRLGRITDTGITHLITQVAGSGVTATSNTVGWVDDGSAYTPFYRRGTDFSNMVHGVTQQTGSDHGYIVPLMKLLPGAVTSWNDSGIWQVGPSGALTQTVREGDPVTTPLRLGQLMHRVAVSSSGFGVYPSYVVPAPGTRLLAAQNRVLIKQNFGSGGAPVIMAQSHETVVPGVPGARFNVFVNESVNASGQIAFAALMAPNLGAVTTANDYGIWREGSAGLELAVREGMPVPNRPGVTFRIFTTHWMLDDGAMMIYATTSASDQGLWRIDTDGSIRLVVGFGQTYDFANGTAFAGFYLRPDVSPSGRYVAAVTLTVGVAGATHLNNRLLLSGDSANPTTMDLSIRSGTLYDVNGTLRTVRNFFTGLVSGNPITTTGGTGGMSRVINDAGQTAMWIHFADGTSGPFINPAP